jgi:LmbE family N-acetylglucosaminyl deacetylase
MKKKILVIAVHPDDEVLGCGGTIFKHRRQGDDVKVLFISGGNDDQKSYISEVTSILDVSYVNLDLPDMYLADKSLNEIIPMIAKCINEYKPEVLYIPNRSDAHSDHRAIFEAMIPFSKSFRYPYIKEIYMCEVHSETDLAFPLIENTFQSNCYIDISAHWEMKKKAMLVYKSELLDYPLTRSMSSIEAKNRYRGSLISVEYAESFQILKKVM